jgi:CDP-paratose 2-epimerase
MKVFITGGVGFIGTNCTLWFARQNHELILLDDFSRFGVEHNAQFLQQKFPQIQIIQEKVQNIVKNQAALQALQEADLILHLAGQTAVTHSIKDPQHDFENNLIAGFSLLELVRTHNPEATLIFASTNKVYGNLSHHQLKKDNKQQKYINLTMPDGINEQERLKFISPYGCSKGALDQYFIDYARNYNLKTVVFRQSCIYGPYQMGVEDQGWVAHFSKQILSGRPITIFGDGYQVRDLLLVDDLARAYQLAHEQIAKVQGEVFNIGGGPDNAYSLLQVLDLLEQAAQTSVKLKFDEARLGDQLWFVSDNHKLKKILNWEPQVRFETGLKILIAWQQKFLKFNQK